MEREGPAQETVLGAGVPHRFQPCSEAVVFFPLFSYWCAMEGASQTFDFHLQCSKVTPVTKIKANQLLVYVRVKNNKLKDDYLKGICN